VVLTDREIQIAIQQGLIRVTPAPAAERYSSTSVDLTLAAEIRLEQTLGTPERGYRGQFLGQEAS
jgi:deoxycytidine triphosphate deaminase